MKKAKRKEKDEKNFYPFSRRRNKVSFLVRNENDFLRSLTVAEKLHFVSQILSQRFNIIPRDSGSKIQCIFSKIDGREGTEEKNGARTTVDISLKYHFSRKKIFPYKLLKLLFKILVSPIFDSNFSASIP